MSNFDVTKPDFSSELKKLETSDPGHANTFNPLFERLIKNDVQLSKNIDSINVPVTKVNNKTGDISLKAEDIKTNDGETIESHLAENVKQLETKMDKQIKDDSTTKKYELGIKNGLIYYREVIV